MFGKERVEMLEVFPIEMSAVFVKDPELEIDILPAELTSVLESPVEVLVGSVKRSELRFVIKLVSSGMVISCSIEVRGKVFCASVCAGLDIGIDVESAVCQLLCGVIITVVILDGIESTRTVPWVCAPGLLVSILFLWFVEGM